MSKAKQPNILFAVMDDGSHASAYGHEFVATPNFDWVASQGALYNNAYTTNPKCAPSRASICTGMHTWQLEDACCHVVITFPGKFATYQELLADNGYHVGYTGKGWGPGHWEATRKWNPAGPAWNEHQLVPPEKTNIRPCDYTENFRAFMAAKKDDQPFSFWFGCFEPHRGYVPGEGRRNGKKVEDVRLPSYWPDDPIVKEDLMDYAYEIDYFDSHLGQMLDILREQGELDNTIIVVTSDNGCPFPRVKGQMYQQDFNLPMAVCWPKLNNGGRVVDDFVSFTDFAPTFLDAAGMPLHEQFSGSSFMDLITSHESGKISSDRDFVTMGRENHDSGREGDVGYPVRCIRRDDYLYVRNFEPDRWPAGNPETLFGNCDGSPTKDLIIEMNDQGRHKYFDLCFGKRPLEELFNVAKDPECLNNLALDVSYDSLKDDLWETLEAYLHKTEDPRIKGDHDYFDRFVLDKYDKDQSSWKAYKEGRFVKAPYLEWKRFELTKEY